MMTYLLSTKILTVMVWSFTPCGSSMRCSRRQVFTANPTSPQSAKPLSDNTALTLIY